MRPAHLAGGSFVIGGYDSDELAVDAAERVASCISSVNVLLDTHVQGGHLVLTSGRHSTDIRACVLSVCNIPLGVLDAVDEEIGSLCLC